VVYLIVRATGGGADGIGSVLTDGDTYLLLARSAGLAAAVTATACGIAVPLAWLTERTDLPGARAWRVLCALPLVVPSFVAGYVFIAGLGPRGLLQGWLEPLGVQRLPSIYGFTGSWLVLSLFTYPYVYLIVRAAVRGLDPALQDAARSLGERRVLRRVVLPQLRPSILAGGLLVALYTLHDFGAVSLMRYDTFTRAIYTQYRGSFDRSRAAMLGIMLVGLTLVVLVTEMRSRGRAAYLSARAGGGTRIRTARLGRSRWLWFGVCCLLVSSTLVLPLAVILIWLARGIRAGQDIGVPVSVVWNSLQASALGAVIALVAAWQVALLAVRYPGRLSRAVERASFVGYALPGVVVALALVFLGARYAPALYQTLGMLAFAYAILFLPQATGALRSTLLQVDPALEDAARSLGASRARTMRTVVGPLVRHGIVAGVALVFLTAMKELPATLMLAPTGFTTLATRVWDATHAAGFARAAASSLALLAVSSVPLALLLARRERWDR